MTYHAPRCGMVAGWIALVAMACALPPAFAKAPSKASPGKAAKSASAPALAAAPGKPRAITTVHRCIEADGRRRYSQTPCPASSAASAMRLGDSPTLAQMRQGHEIQARMRKLDQGMQQDRQRLEREGARRKAASLTVPDRKNGSERIRDGKTKAQGGTADKTASRPEIRKPTFTARVPRQQSGSPHRVGTQP